MREPVNPAAGRVRVHLIAAARPNFMKIAPLYHALSREPWCEVKLVHTGQHYDPNMSDAFFRDLRLPKPDFHLEVGSGSHAEQTGGVMIAYERVAVTEKPDWIVVVGDVNSTAACAMVGSKLWIPVIHLEAGLRSRDRRMPEEINRLVTDAIADVLWTPSPDANDNLRAEGVPADRVDFVGNIMIDCYVMMRDVIAASGARTSLGFDAGAYGVVTLHRPSNVDTREALTPLVEELGAVAEVLPLVFAVHPRTRKRLVEFGLYDKLAGSARVRLVDPMGYVDFMNVVSGARAVITDSGGVQEETTFLHIPCMTLRDSTERPVTVTEGSNRLIRAEELRARVEDVLHGRWPAGRVPALWEGSTAARCVEALKRRAGVSSGSTTSKP